MLALYFNSKGRNVPPEMNYIVEVKAILLYIMPGWPITSRALFVEFRRCPKIFKIFFKKGPFSGQRKTAAVSW